MESLNLASCHAGSSVCSSAVSYSLTPLTNLLAGLDWMTDTFIKPPVTVTLHLPLPVKLSRLEWNTRLGSQSSLSHEVHVATELEALARGGGGEGGEGGCSCSQEGCSPLYKVGYGSAGTDGRIVFTNRRLARSGDTQGVRLHCRENFSALDTVTAVVIKITRTLSSSVPCIANLKIFGESSGLQQFRPAEQRLLSLQSASAGAPHSHSLTYFGGEGEVVQAQPGQAEAEEETRAGDSEDIPVEFLDSLTHSLMSLPMTLPSGHQVDRTTVERCEEMFRSRGAQPRDPFTGKLLSQSYKPVFNAALKSRIDRFVLTRRDRRELLSGGQTLGCAEAIQKFFSLKEPARAGEKRKLHCDNINLSRDLTDLVSSTPDDLNQADDEDHSDDDLDNTDLNQALKRTLSKRQKIIKY